jgi:hypothetical protein
LLCIILHYYSIIHLYCANFVIGLRAVKFLHTNKFEFEFEIWIWIIIIIIILLLLLLLSIVDRVNRIENTICSWRWS